MTQTITPRARTLVLLLLAVAGMLLAGAAPASAHAALLGSDPQQGVVVTEPPTQVTLTFSERVAMSDDSLRVLDPKGRHVEVGKPANTGGTTYAIQLKSGLGDGTYTITYQVISADSHPVSGALTFSVGKPSATAVSASSPAVGGGVVGWLYGFGRYVSYAGFILMVGGATFVLACWQRGSGVRAVQRLVVSGWLSLTGATLALLLLRGSYTTSGKVGDVFDLGLLGQVLQTKPGAALVSRLLLLAAGALFIAVLFGAYDKREDEEKRDLTFGLAVGGGVVAAGLAASWAMAEHASTGLQPGIAMPVDVVHLLAVAAWLGGLVTLLVALYRAPAEAPIEAAAVRRFSRLAFGSVLALIATGTYQSWRQLGSWSALVDTSYGRLLLVKIGLVTAMVAIATVSRRWTGRLTAPAGEAAEAFEAGETREVEEAAPESGETAEPAVAMVPAGRGTSAAEGSDGAGSSAGAGMSAAGTAAVSTDVASGTEPGAPGEASDAGGTAAGSGTSSPSGTGSASPASGTAPASAGSGTSGLSGTGSASPASGTAPASAGSGTSGLSGTGSASPASGTAPASAGSGTGGASAAPGTGGASVAGGAAGDGPAGDSGRAGEAAEAAAGSGDGSPRAAQLARQEAARESARRKRLRDADPQRFGLRHSVLAEAGIAVVLLAVTTVLTQTEPARTVAQVDAAKAAASSSSGATSPSGAALTLDMSFDTGGTDGKGVVRLDLDPAATGPNTLDLYVQRPNGRAFDIPEVKVAFTLETRNIGPLTVAPDHVATGHWKATGVQLPLSGSWKVAVTVRTSDIDQVTISKNAQIG
ncbi:copper resistance protein CopC [Streptomyces mangrovisoli]|uniref:copper resistance protein CopC n=1 Tax=Streptomyces mangrovisoli TaxID=1428628 RepID=UPI00062255C3|nr:copper resistance protein CopC [Streptomyces mangrovisoli]